MTFIFGWNFYLDSQFTTSMTAGVLAAFTFYYVVFLQYAPKTLHNLKVGISFIFTGFLSNSMNKVLTGSVTDTFYLDIPFLTKIFFNLADVVQILGWIAVIIGSRSVVKAFLFPKKLQKTKSLYPKIKFNLWLFFLFAFFCLSFFFVLLNWQFIGFIEKTTNSDMLISYSFFKYSFLVLVAICLFIAAFLIYFSNTVYGPFLAFKRHIHALLKDKNASDLKLRKK